MRYTGAGVIPYTKRDDGIHILLGKENWNRDWPEGSHKWSGFSGRLESNEKPVQCAAREFFEETCACVPTSRDCAVVFQNVVRCLQEHAHLLETRSADPSTGDELVYSSYVLPVPDGPYGQIFAQTRLRLMEMERVLCNYYCHMHRFRQRYGMGFVFPGYRFGPHVAVCNLHVHASARELAISYCDDAGDLFNQTLCLESSELLQSLKHIADAWHAILQYMEASDRIDIIDHPAVNVQRVGHSIVHVSVNKNFMEKCELDWWKLSDVLKEESESQRFRRLFLDFVPQLACLVVDHGDGSFGCEDSVQRG